jgi:hypothetical protein
VSTILGFRMVPVLEMGLLLKCLLLKTVCFRSISKPCASGRASLAAQTSSHSLSNTANRPSGERNFTLGAKFSCSSQILRIMSASFGYSQRAEVGESRPRRKIPSYLSGFIKAWKTRMCGSTRAPLPQKPSSRTPPRTYGNQHRSRRNRNFSMPSRRSDRLLRPDGLSHQSLTNARSTSASSSSPRNPHAATRQSITHQRMLSRAQREADERYEVTQENVMKMNELFREGIHARDFALKNLGRRDGGSRRLASRIVDQHTHLYTSRDRMDRP